MPKQVNWKDPEIDAVLRKHAGKLSASQIALLIPNATRSSVVGRMDRLNLEGMPQGHYVRMAGTKQARLPSQQRTPGATTPPVHHPRGFSGTMLAQTSVAERSMGAGQYKMAPITDDVPLDLPNLWCEPVDLIDLKEHHCRWPMDGGKSCGLTRWYGNPYGDTPYCIDHHRLGHKAPSEHVRLNRRV